tara:strand:+ start:714 stop:1637 length:924 start_codon:yes stop_codon:yes gene_type:complete
LKNKSSYFHDLFRLKQHQERISYLPARGKQPRQADWPNQPGITIDDFFNYPGSNSIGVRTGAQHGPLAIFDIDGESALKLSCDRGMKPSEWITWQIHRHEAPSRLKLLCIPTPEQIKQLERLSFIATVKTKSPIKDSQGNLVQKGEGLEFFFGGKQGIVWGHHPEGGRYFWPDGFGPEALSAPPDQWWQFAVEQSRRIGAPRCESGGMRYPRGERGRRLDPCPICGRCSGNGSELWCEAKGELLFCMPGSTYSAVMSHPGLKVGDVIDGWAAVKNNRDGGWTFRRHRINPIQAIRQRLFEDASSWAA